MATDPSEQLTQLAKMRADGALTEEEYKTLKTKIIYGTETSIAPIPPTPTKLPAHKSCKSVPYTTDWGATKYYEKLVAPAQTTENHTASPKPDYSETADEKPNPAVTAYIKAESIAAAGFIGALIVVFILLSLSPTQHSNLFSTLLGREMDLSTILFWCALIGLIPAYIGWKKGHSFFIWWLCGALLWIVALPAILILKPNQEELDRRRQLHGEIRCPFCKQFVRVDATICPYCQRDIRTEEIKTPPLEQLSKIKSLLDSGVITQQEFDDLKRRLLASMI